MKWFSFGLGVLCILYAGLYFLGLLPVDFWQSTIDLVIGREPDAYYQIVPAETARYEGLSALSLGVVLLALSRWPLKRGQKQCMGSGLAFCLLGKPGLDKKNARPGPKVHAVEKLLRLTRR